MKTSEIENGELIGRIKYLIEMSRMTQLQFAKRIGIDPSNLSKHLSGKLPVSESLINRIVVDLGVSKQWLRQGIDVPFPKEHLPQSIEKGAYAMATGECRPVGVPVYDIDVTAGCAELSRMFTQDRIVGYVDLPRLNPQCSIVKVSGDSMEPVIHNGGYIAVRPLSNCRNIFWGQIYVILMEDYRMVKFVKRHQDDNKVILHSANAHYDDMEVLKSDILNLYIVESIINYDLRC